MTMMWTVKTILTDRRNGIAGIVAAATAHGIVLMGLRSRPGWNGWLVDEIVLVTPGGWTAERLEQLLLEAGASTAQITAQEPEEAHGVISPERAARVAHPAGAGRSWLAHPRAS